MSVKNKIWMRKTLLVAVLGCISTSSFAEITLLKQDPQAGDPLSRLNFEFGGSIRPQISNVMGESDKGSYKNNGYDGGTRFRFTANYYLFDDVSLIGYYELGTNLPAIMGWDHHYADGANNTDRRMLYTGLQSEKYGTLTFGKQNSVYYNVVGVKTDIWDNDMQAQAPNHGFNGSYDGSYMGRKLLQYKNTFGATDVYVGGILADDDYIAGPDLRYKRKGGAALGADYHITPDLTWGTVYSYTSAEVKSVGSVDADSTRYDQQLLGSGLSWKPDNWTLAMSGGWYHDFLMTTLKQQGDYFAGNAYGVEYYAGYTFPVESFGVKNITPYYSGDYLKYMSGRDYQSTHQYVGVTAALDYGFKIDLEHTFSNTTDDQGDVNLVRLSYDF